MLAAQAAEAAAESGDGYIKSSSFTGPKAGYVFKLGSLGQGYYVDGASGVPADADEEIDIDDEEEDKEDDIEGIEQKKVRPS